jgi:glycosyltransferase involved in cell wall biosynthesis/ubiquinone/menaquinone biosynthesis C-methylase UbiE
MTATATRTLPDEAVVLTRASDADLFWRQNIAVRLSTTTHAVALTNFAGRNYPTLDADALSQAIAIPPGGRVLDILASDVPFERATTLYNVEPNAACPRLRAGQEWISGTLDALPFEESAFDVALCRGFLSCVRDPATACRELQRVAKRGFIETPAPLAEYLGGNPASRWLVQVERLPEREPTLVFRRRPFRRAPFRHALRGRWFADELYRFRWEWQYRNVVFTQFAWEGGFNFRVEEDEHGFDYDDPAQAFESHLDAAIQGVRFGNVHWSALLPDAEKAVALQPDRAIAHNTRGCVLWLARRTEEAIAAFREAAQLEPTHPGYARNARLNATATHPHLHLEMLPPELPDVQDIAYNFGGKVFYAFVGYDDRLAEDMGIRPGEKVLDVGGGQRPLKRADVSVDFDVFEGVHRQGQSISRDKPLVCGDVQRLPFATHAFDVACCRMVLEHVLDPAAACRELQRVAKRGFLETPNTFWECFYGHPTHRWLVEWEEPTRTLIFKRKPFDSIPFQSAILPFLYTQRDIQRAFEVTFRNITTTQITWDEDHPFRVRVEDDPEAPYDYLNRPEDATRGSLNYAQDILESGLPSVAVAEAEDALRLAPTPELREKAIRLRVKIAQSLGDTGRLNELLAQRRAEAQQGSASGAPSLLGSNQATEVVWNAPLLDPSGYADEARHFLFALHSIGYPVAARELRWSNKFAVLTRDRERLLRQMLMQPARPGAVQICHILASAFQRDPNARANIGRTMFETDRLPEGWAHACNQMDAVWVPGEFNRQTFAFSGVAPEKLRIVPGAIDLTPYSPDVPALRIDGAKGYNFLALFDWTLRKGWDVLLRAFAEEFHPDEDVSLIIKTHSSMGYTVQAIVDQAAHYLSHDLGLDLNRLPAIIFQDTNIPDALMPALYKAADCYVMPTRGEGWGRPFMEAMAMGLPVIGTNWSGQTAFMTPENSLLLDYTLVEVPEVAWRETPTYRGHRWAEPSRTHLRQLMRRAFADRALGRELGLRARADLETHFSYTVVAQIVREELERAGIELAVSIS